MERYAKVTLILEENIEDPDILQWSSVRGIGKEEPVSFSIISNFWWFLKGALCVVSLGGLTEV